jgi:CRP-like cAMP-binding protein
MAQIDLRALPSLREYANSELKMLASVAPAREYPPGLPLCREGAAGASCFLLAVGTVRIEKQQPDGVKTLATLRAGAIVGQMALVDRSPRSATVVAAEPTIALELTRDVFENLLRASSPLALRFQEQIAIAGIRQLRMATSRLAGIVSEQKIKAEQEAAGLDLNNPARAELLSVQAALSEWDMSLDDLDKVKVSVPPGVPLHKPGRL